jgi:hypothetical protein
LRAAQPPTRLLPLPLAGGGWGEGKCYRAICSERFRQACLAQDRIGGVAAWNSDRDGEVSFGDRAVPDFVASLALADKKTAGAAQQIPQRLVELRRHSRSGWFGFAQRSDLQK